MQRIIDGRFSKCSICR